MPFRHLLDGGVFSAEQVTAMAQAYEAVRQKLHDRGQPAIVNEVVAQRIIELAKREALTRERVGGARPRVVRLGGRALTFRNGFNPLKCIANRSPHMQLVVLGAGNSATLVSQLPPSVTYGRGGFFMIDEPGSCTGPVN
jgi:hypothetical protein